MIYRQDLFIIGISAAMVLNVNGVKQEVTVDPDVGLLIVLRDYLNLTGSKYGCGEGACGACTVLINGKASRSCITPVSSVAGKEVTTIEGLEKNGKLHAVQQAFLTTDAFQCSYCASGMVPHSNPLVIPEPNVNSQSWVPISFLSF